MRNLSGNKLTIGICILAAMLSTGPRLDGVTTGSSCDEGVDLQIVADKNSYAPGATMRVKLLVTNISKTPLYLFRNVGQCSSQLGWLSVELRDQRNHQVKAWDCSIDDLLMGDRNVVEMLTNAMSGVFLNQGEIYGQQEEYELPKRKGTYRLQAELAPAGFLTEDQKQALEEHHMRVLRKTCLAPTVTITVKGMGLIR